MITRDQWGAKPPTHAQSGWQGGQPTGVAVHYVGGSGYIGLSDHAQCFNLMRSIQKYAQTGGNGWTYSDIEYNLAACPHGEVFEGRGLHYQGAAQLDANNTHLSVLVMANVRDTITGSPLAAATNAAIALAQQTFPSIHQVVGHRDTAGNPTGTNCPGDLIEQWLNAGRPGNGAPTPPPEVDDVEHGQAVDTVCAAGGRLITLSRGGELYAVDGNDNKISVVGTGYWPGQDVARKIVLAPLCARSRLAYLRGWVQDLDGGLHGFAEAGKTPPPTRSAAYFKGGKIVAFNES